MPVSVCPHCLEITQALSGCGAVLEATSHHYAMALVRAMKAERRPLTAILDLLLLLEQAPELEPPSSPVRLVVAPPA